MFQTKTGRIIMKKIAFILLLCACTFVFNSRILANDEKEDFQNIAESIKSYSKSTLSDKEIENDFCAKKFEAKEVFYKWDKLLNDVYKYLKATKSPDEFNSIKQQQRNWIKEKEAKAKSVEKVKDYDDRQEKDFNVYKVYIDFTSKRCQELIDLVVNNEQEALLVIPTEQQIQYESFQDSVTTIERIDKSVCEDGMLAQYEINNMSVRICKKWENLMKEMLAYLKANLSDEDYSAIDAEQKKVVEEAEKKANQASKDWEGGSGETMAKYSAYTEVWSKRCKVLLENINKYVLKNEKSSKSANIHNENKSSSNPSAKVAFQEYFDVLKEKDLNINKTSDNNTLLKAKKELFSDLDMLLNKVYKHMKNTLSPEDFEIVKQAQREWIKEKESASKEALNNNENGKGELNKINSDISFTITRVEILIDLLEE